MSIASQLGALIALICLTGTAAPGFEPMTATIRVSSGDLYDYVLIGEQSKATDGFDNAYDTISPGNLNADMGEPFIAAVMLHPDWKPGLREMRGDIRAMAKKQQWQLCITSTLAKGARLTVALQAGDGALPKGVRLTLRDGGKEADLRRGEYILPAPGPGTSSTIFIIAEQP